MKNSFKIIVFSSVIFSSCTKNGNSGDGVDIYVAGAISGSGSVTATYWKNGEAVTLNDSSGYATGIAVSGDDVYVAGYVFKGSGTYSRFWKNGKPIMLTDGSDSDYRSAPNGYFPNTIAISGNDVYVAGYVRNGSKSIAKYWKNRVPVTLGNPSDSQSYAIAIAVSGTDVYALGYEAGVATYWKNGIPTALSGGGNAFNIAASGSDAYVAGNGTSTLYWKNNSPVNLIDSFQAPSTTSIAISGNDVYVAGYGDGSDGSIYSLYWKNGNLITLAKNSQAFSIAVSVDDVYVAGYTGANAVYWKNGSQIILGPGQAYAVSLSR